MTENKMTVDSKHDPRFQNKLISAESVNDYLKKYSEILTQTLQKVDPSALQGAFELLAEITRSGKKVFIGGNGGSAAISDHLCCDWSKGVRKEKLPTPRVQSLVANGPLLTALCNDYGYEFGLSTQLEMFAEKGDLVILISSSGNSPNVLKAAQFARENGLKSIGFTGFTGGELARLVDVNLHADFHNYGLVEDTHQALMHILAQYFAMAREN